MASHKLVQPNTPTVQRQASQPEAPTAETLDQPPASTTTIRGARSRPDLLAPGAILGLQRTLGNQAVIRLRAAEQRRPPPARASSPAGSPHTNMLQRNGDPRGLPNRKFDCFLNAILQIMAGPYAAFFNPATNNLATWRGAANEQQVQALARAQRVQAAVWVIIQRINNADQTAISKEDIGNLRQTLLLNKMVLSEGDQEDAAELMRKLLEPVLPPEQSIGVSVERRIEDKDTKAIKKDQLGTDPAKYTKAPSSTVGARKHGEATNMIAVDMDRYNSLQAFLYEQFGKGVVTEYDPKNRPKVKYNEEAVEVSKVTERRAFTHLPNLVTFNLKRFRERFEGGKERVGKPFAMPKTLFLVNESLPTTKSYVEYELAGVVVQTGTLSGGHYYGHIKRGDKWHRADDATITENRIDEDIDQGYIYTYRRVRDHSALPKGAAAAQETEPKPGDISLGAELRSYSGLLDSGGKSSTTPTPGTPSTRIQGLKNRADDCFLNAVLQLMAGSFATLFDPSNNKLPGRNGNLQGWIWSLMQRINKSKKGDQSITKEEIGRLRKAMVNAKVIQGESGQEDAAEVVRRLLALVTSKADTGTIETERTFDIKDSHHIKKSNLPKNPASYILGRSKGALDTNVIEVEMENFNSLEGFLYHHYGIGETIEYDEENRPKVLHGGFAVELSKIKQRKIFRQLPPQLTFILHRFQIDKEGHRVRIDRKFAMPEQLILVEQPPKVPKHYVGFELVGVVVQTGGLESGHYYTHRKDETGGGWLHANDANVTESADIGPDLNEGYVYTYRRKGQSDTLPTGAQAAQEHQNFAADNLGIRLVDRIAAGRYAEALELLTFPTLDVNAQTKEQGTPLYQAVKKQRIDLVRRLLMRGANPATRGPDGSPQEISAGKSYTNNDIRMALQIYSMSDFSKIIAQIRDVKPNKGTKLDTASMLQAYEKLSTIEQLLNEQATAVTSPLKASMEKMTGLAQGLEAVQQQRRLLNEWLADFYEIKRAGAGKRPDASKAVNLPVVDEAGRQALLEYIEQLHPKPDKAAQKPSQSGSKKPAKKERTPAQILESHGKTEREKDTQEALTALFATRQQLFDQITPGKGKFAGDIDFQADEEPWDQKVIVRHDSTPFEGRLLKTHHKLNKGPVNEKIDATTRPSERTSKAKPAYQKVGLLLDSSYIDERNYEQTWQNILTSVLSGDLDPRYIKETRAPEDVQVISENFFDVKDASKGPQALSVLTAEKLAKPGSSMPVISSTALPKPLQAELEKIVQKQIKPYTRHENNRGWLPGDFLYFEYPTPGNSPKDLSGNHCKLVVSHDLQHIYLTCWHYAAFSYRDGDKIINRTPFYEIIPEGSLATAMGKSAPTPSPDSSTPTTVNSAPGTTGIGATPASSPTTTTGTGGSKAAKKKNKKRL